MSCSLTVYRQCDANSCSIKRLLFLFWCVWCLSSLNCFLKLLTSFSSPSFPLLPSTWTSFLLIHIYFVSVWCFFSFIHNAIHLFSFYLDHTCPTFCPSRSPPSSILPLPPSVITLCFSHSLGIWMTVSCGAFCLCWPASVSSSSSSRLSFFLSVATSHCVIFFSVPPD